MRIRPIDGDLEDLNDRYNEFHRRSGKGISVWLRLDELVHAAGLDLVEFTGRYTITKAEPGLRGPMWAAREASVKAALTTPADVARWSAAFDRADDRPDRLTWFVPLFIRIGRAPTPDAPT